MRFSPSMSFSQIASLFFIAFPSSPLSTRSYRNSYLRGMLRFLPYAFPLAAAAINRTASSAIERDPPPRYRDAVSL